MKPVCPHCLQTLLPPIPVIVTFRGLRRSLLERLHRAGPHGMTMEAITDFLYGGRPDGGPATADEVIRVFVSQINKQIKPQGKRIRCRGWGRNTPGEYVFEDFSDGR